MNTTAVCACQATNEKLAAWGWTVEVRTHCVGAWHVVTPGMSRSAALAKATRAGHVMVGSCKPCRDARNPSLPRTAWTPPKVDQAMLAFLLGTKATV